ncbi:MAG TPA: hypothetical protein VK846_04270 [Candidatus Limnocylindria bacterium]|nr:hypothetical protein [Candidatus Limnocylindria bacterium]
MPPLIADNLVQQVATLDLLTLTALTPEERDTAQQQLDEPVNVELVFKQQITQNQLNTFAALGGEVTYIFRAVSYGWNGRVPLTRVPDLPQALGATLVLVDEPLAAVLHMDAATRTGRVRPMWAAGFAGSVAGYSGNSTITIAIVDSGVDESHLDLNGRPVYWTNHTTGPGGQKSFGCGDVVARHRGEHHSGGRHEHNYSRRHEWGEGFLGGVARQRHGRRQRYPQHLGR